MNKRILKIDAEQRWPHDNEPKCKVQFNGCDADGDRLYIELSGEDARDYLRLAQAVAGQEQRTVDALIDGMNERRTLAHEGSET